MKWAEVLEKNPSAKISFPGETFTYQKLAEKMSSSHFSERFIWRAVWSLQSVAEFLKALDDEVSVVVESSGITTDRKIESTGFIYLSSSGTEGPSRYYAHKVSTLKNLKPSYFHSQSGALLRPQHAAGIEYFLSGLLGGNDLTLLGSAEDLKAWNGSILHGPPSLLGYLLSFPEKFSKTLRTLKSFYSGTDSLSPVWVHKKNLEYPDMKIHQVYGSTETWSLNTITHPEKSWLMKFDDSSVLIRDGKIFVNSDRVSLDLKLPYMMSDVAVFEEDDWFSITGQRYWVVSLMGEKINLFDLESKILNLPGVIDVLAVSKKTLFGDKIEVSYVGEVEESLIRNVEPKLELKKVQSLPHSKRKRHT